MPTSSIGGPRKAYTNRCTNSSPRYSVRTTMLSSFVCLRNFLGFRLNDKHNASKNSNMSWREFSSIRCKSMKNNQINSVKAILIFSFLVFYNLNPLLGVFSSFLGVAYTQLFFEFLKLHFEPFEYGHTVNAQPEFSLLLRVPLQGCR